MTLPQITLPIALLLLAACDFGTQTPSPAKASLLVEVQGLPEGVAPRVEVSGGSLVAPALLSARGLNPALTDLEAGQYLVTPLEAGTSPRYTAPSQSLSLAAGERGKVVVTYTTPTPTTGTVAVTVTGLPDGVRARLTLTPLPPSGGNTISRDITGSGTFSISSLPVSSYTLSAVATGFDAAPDNPAPLMIVAGQTVARSIAFSRSKGTLNVTVLIDKAANPTAADPSISVSITNASGVVGNPITATGSAPPQLLDEGTYTVAAANSSGYTVSITPNSDIVISATTPTSVTITYTATIPGRVSAAKTFISSFGIGSLAFLNSSGSGQGRLYASGNASTPTSSSGRLFLEPSDISGAVPSSQIALAQGLARVALSSSGVLYELSRANLGMIPATVLSRFARATAVNNAFTPLDLVITNGAFTFGSPPTTEYGLLAPTDIALDGFGNLWMVDPTSNARNNIDGLIPTPPAGRLVCYSTADQTAASASSTRVLNTPGVIYYGTAIAGAQTLAFDGAGNLWVGSGNGATARLVKIQVSALRTSQTPSGACPNLPNTGSPDNELLNLNSTGVSSLTGTALAGPVDLTVSGSNLLIAQSDGSINNILTVPLSATSLPTTPPTTINGLAGAITSIAVDSGGKTWVGTSGASWSSQGRIYQLP